MLNTPLAYRKYGSVFIVGCAFAGHSIPVHC